LKPPARRSVKVVTFREPRPALVPSSRVNAPVDGGDSESAGRAQTLRAGA
ncbi:hypothetical protein C8J27_1171, partial [Rhodobacter aestuarii]